jgi:prepilin-type N-terminal cleavage/methylation domain-containing protein/prepilin-type processing-associated H-X9-DG protein
MRTTDLHVAPLTGGLRRVRRQDDREAFTLVELLVVIAVIAILASLAMPAMGTAKREAQSTSCLNNFRQLQAAWYLYTVDYNDQLPANKWFAVDWQDGCPSGNQTTSDSWVMGDATTDRDTWNIQNGCLFPYTRSTPLYHCPTDLSTIYYRRDILRKRSYSMSYYMNGSEQKPERKTKLCQIKNTAGAFVFIDEQENSISDGVFFVHVPRDDGERAEARDNPTYGGAHYMNMPADRHGQGCNLSFTDGHVEHWKWKSPKQATADAAPASQLDFQDLRHLQTAIPSR